MYFIVLFEGLKIIPSVKLNYRCTSVDLHKFPEFRRLVTVAHCFFRVPEFISETKLRRTLCYLTQEMLRTYQVRQSAVIRQRLQYQLMFHVAEWID